MTQKVDPGSAAIAEAAVWLARLRSDERPREAADEFRIWLGMDEANPVAFETVSDAWELAGGIASRRLAVDKPATGRWRLPAMAACATLVALFSAWQLDRSSGITTDVGEQRSVRLADGSTVTLNTATRIRVQFAKGQRTVWLDEGEASFDVAKDATRPFVVEAGTASVTAIGTEFDVRWLDGTLAVTLAEGVVRVLEDSGTPAAAGAVELRPGQRLTDKTGTPPLVRSVNLSSARSWRSGQLVFDETPLSGAVAEMNRYSAGKIWLADGVADDLRISGAFKAGGSAEFARALADLYGLRVAEGGADYVLAPAIGAERN